MTKWLDFQQLRKRHTLTEKLGWGMGLLLFSTPPTLRFSSCLRLS